ncbi:MAG: hypothetical protein EXR62_08350 [Chloroflexi bacterium]|nr:hypothetical protein [Chloroflexota bacterium]
MNPIEILFFTIVLIFAAIGVVRGFLRELGATLIILVAIYIVADLLDSRRLLATGVRAVNTAYPNPIAGGLDRALSSETILFLLYTTIIIAVTFMSYQGDTLDFKGKNPPGLSGAFMGGLVGAINGYLVGGTIWAYMDKFGYPTKELGLIRPDLLSSFAKMLISYLPIPMLEPLLLPLVLILILLRVLK